MKKPLKIRVTERKLTDELKEPSSFGRSGRSSSSGGGNSGKSGGGGKCGSSRAIPTTKHQSE